MDDSMILSVSRRTDIPNYYAEWFYNRIREGFLYVRNPMNPHQISKINLSPDIVDCIVFWTKNPANMLPGLENLRDYAYYFQFTLTGYGKDIEPNLPNKRTDLIKTFQSLSERIGNEKVIWRYDPILRNETYTLEYHIKAFREIAGRLNGYTRKVVISFVDFYAKTRRNAEDLHIKGINSNEIMELAEKLAEIAKENHLSIETCAEQIDLKEAGITHGSCIDSNLIEQLIGCSLKVNKDKNQREDCGCVESVEAGTYNTCKSGCKYCYANFNEAQVRRSLERYDVNSPLLCGDIGEEDKITERKVKSFRETQINLFDYNNR